MGFTGLWRIKIRDFFNRKGAKISAKFAKNLEFLCETPCFFVDLCEIAVTQSYTKKIHKDAQSFKVERKLIIQHLHNRKSKIVNQKS